MSSSYVLDIEPKIFTLVKAQCYTELKQKFPKIFFTTSDEVSENPQFPTVYICEDSSTEKDKDLLRKSINSVVSVFDVKVTVDTSKQDVSYIMGKVLNAFVDVYGFELVSKSKVVTDANMFYMKASFRMKIGSDDVL